MRNEKIVNVQVSRLDLVNLMMACTSVELNVEGKSKEKWRNLYNTLKEQLNAFDAKLDEEEKA